MFKKISILFLLSLIVLIAGFSFLAQQSIVLPDGKDRIVVEIKKGQTLSQLAYGWEKQGWLPSAKILLIQARVLDSAKKIKPGEFEIPEHTKAFDLLALLTQGSSKRYKVSFIEGTRLTDALIRLKNAPKLLQDVQPLTTEKVKELLGLENLAEGWVYPDTYVYQAGDSASSILKQAHHRMKDVLQQEWQEYLSKVASNDSEKLPYRSAYEALIMASIVEKETGQVSERPEIAGVFVRRLQMNMRLETDPTVIYGLKDQFDGDLTRAHLKQYTPYNTYRIKALPPTPIAMPSYAAIQAALSPESSNYYYFVAKGDGSHQFSENLSQHNQAVRKYQLKKKVSNDS